MCWRYLVLVGDGGNLREVMGISYKVTSRLVKKQLQASQHQQHVVAAGQQAASGNDMGLAEQAQGLESLSIRLLLTPQAGAAFQILPFPKGKLYLGRGLPFSLNAPLRQAVLTHNGPAGHCSAADDNARPPQERHRAGLNRGRAVGGLHHGVHLVSGGAATHWCDCCLARLVAPGHHRHRGCVVDIRHNCPLSPYKRPAGHPSSDNHTGPAVHP